MTSLQQAWKHNYRVIHIWENCNKKGAKIASRPRWSIRQWFYCWCKNLSSISTWCPMMTRLNPCSSQGTRVTTLWSPCQCVCVRRNECLLQLLQPPPNLSSKRDANWQIYETKRRLYSTDWKLCTFVTPQNRPRRTQLRAGQINYKRESSRESYFDFRISHACDTLVLYYNRATDSSLKMALLQSEFRSTKVKSSTTKIPQSVDAFHTNSNAWSSIFPFHFCHHQLRRRENGNGDRAHLSRNIYAPFL